MGEERKGGIIINYVITQGHLVLPLLNRLGKATQA